MAIRILVFLIINFAALGIGGIFTGKGVQSAWYQNLNMAPWTPPGWVFGAAWTTIMICFSIYLAFAWEQVENQKFLTILFIIQWVLNVIWNPVFFHFHAVLFALLVISLLTFLVTYIFIVFYPSLKFKSTLLLPYVIWLFIATSLNAYTLFKN